MPRLRRLDAMPLAKIESPDRTSKGPDAIVGAVGLVLRGVFEPPPMEMVEDFITMTGIVKLPTEVAALDATGERTGRFGGGVGLRGWRRAPVRTIAMYVMSHESGNATRSTLFGPP